MRRDSVNVRDEPLARPIVRREPSSFRDPSGFVFYKDDLLLRQVNQSYGNNYRQLMDSGLYDVLVSRGLLVPHREVDISYSTTDEAYTVIQPERVPMITYPYEWCFGQLREAALTTLRIERIALEYGMCLKDASAYNLQFVGSSTPMMIDTLSFEPYVEGEPWVAYRQFCQHFLAPLALAAHCDVRLMHLLRVYVDGIPLDLASRLLPKRTLVSPQLLMHLHMHSASQRKHANSMDDANTAEHRSRRQPNVSRNGLLGIIGGLTNAVKRLNYKRNQTEWGEYYAATNYVNEAVRSKEALVLQLLEKVVPTPEMVLDLGANTGRFSRLALQLGATVIAADIDPVAVESNYAKMRKEGETSVVPLLLDLTNPPGGSGWSNEERPSLFDRAPTQVVMALALIHHLAITNNVGLVQLATFFRKVSQHLIIEFIPKLDSQVQRLLASRVDIFPEYTVEGFEAAFGEQFDVLESHQVVASERRIYLMRARDMN